MFFKCFIQLFFVNSASGQKIWTTLFATILWKQETTSETRHFKSTIKTLVLFRFYAFLVSFELFLFKVGQVIKSSFFQYYIASSVI